MTHEHIIRAWKDEEYRMSLSEEERAQLPENPAGLIDLTDIEMGLVGGGYCPSGESECTWSVSECPSPGIPSDEEPPHAPGEHPLPDWDDIPASTTDYGSCYTTDPKYGGSVCKNKN